MTARRLNKSAGLSKAIYLEKDIRNLTIKEAVRSLAKFSVALSLPFCFEVASLNAYAVTPTVTVAATATMTPTVTPTPTTVPTFTAAFSPLRAELVSKSNASTPVPGDALSMRPAISADGRFVVFESRARNLAPNDPLSPTDPEATATFTPTPTGTPPTATPTITPGGPTLTPTNTPTPSPTNIKQVYLLDRQLNNYIERISKNDSGLFGNRDSFKASVSNNGVYIAFVSASTNLDAANSDGIQQVFVHNRMTGVTAVVSRSSIASTCSEPVGNAASDNPRINGSGTTVVFDSYATNLLTPTPNPTPDIYPGSNVFMRTSSCDTYQINGAFSGGYADTLILPNGDSTNPDVSENGTYKVFESLADNLTNENDDRNGASDIFMTGFLPADAPTGYKRISNKRNRLEAPTGSSTRPSISADGKYVVFQSTAEDIVENDTNGKSDIFFYDRPFGRTVLCSVQPNVLDAPQFTDGDSMNASISDNGRYVVFEFAPEDGSAHRIYSARVLFDSDGKASGCATSLVTLGLSGEDVVAQNGGASRPVVSGDGNLVIFDSTALNLLTTPLPTPTGSAPTPAAQIFMGMRSECMYSKRGESASGPSSRLNCNNDQDGDGVKDCEDVDIDADGVDNCFDQCPLDASKVTDADSDGDGTPDCSDGCTNDGNKVSPGVCGCGESDADSDNDAYADCLDLCPSDPNKHEVGICGCGISDTDADADGVPSCDGTNDKCDNDALKVAEGICGCGVPDADVNENGIIDCNEVCTSRNADIDTDGDGNPDCSDVCRFDPNKQTSAGSCGCGSLETDSDSDGVADCIDRCPADPNKQTTEGVCGCGELETDSDSDNVPDCADVCPNDVSKRTSAGQCGCGVAETDTDIDGVPDCVDLCPTDRTKRAPGTCGCGNSDVDSDNDGTSDCVDLCPQDNAKIVTGLCGCGKTDSTADADGDGTIDCLDGCPTDTAKVAAGVCGCGSSDTLDTDKDGTIDCLDECPSDATLTKAGKCGCGVAETDTNNNDTADCLEPAWNFRLEKPTVSVRSGVVNAVVKRPSYVRSGADLSYVCVFLKEGSGVPPTSVSSHSRTLRFRPGSKFHGYINVRCRAKIDNSYTKLSGAVRKLIR